MEKIINYWELIFIVLAILAISILFFGEWIYSEILLWNASRRIKKRLKKPTSVGEIIYFEELQKIITKTKEKNQL